MSGGGGGVTFEDQLPDPLNPDPKSESDRNWSLVDSLRLRESLLVLLDLSMDLERDFLRFQCCEDPVWLRLLDRFLERDLDLFLPPDRLRLLRRSDLLLRLLERLGRDLLRVCVEVLTRDRVSAPL